MEKDIRYRVVKYAFEAGHIERFADIFNTVPKSVMGRDLGMGRYAFRRRVAEPGMLTMREVVTIGELIEMRAEVVFELVSRKVADRQKGAN